MYLLVTSPRLPAGILTAQAWELLHKHPVLAADESSGTIDGEDDAVLEPSATVEAIRESGVEVELVPGAPAEWARRFREVAATGGAVWIAAADGDAEFATVLGHAVVRESQTAVPLGDIEVVYGSWDPPGARLLDVVTVTDRLRSPGGCPWDAEQTHDSLKPYLLEEAYEAYDALNAGDRAGMIEELGDVLLQTVFHARVAEDNPEPEQWNIDDVAAGLVEKLVRRHPHVFADGHAADATAVERNWEKIKHAEKKRSSALDGVARSQPALSLASKYLARAEKHGLDVAEPSAAKMPLPTDAEELGDLLFAIVAGARREGLDPEAALRAAADRFAGRVRAVEAGS